MVGYVFTQLNFIGLGVSDVLFNTSVGIATVWIAGGGGGSGNVSIGSEAPTSLLVVIYGIVQNMVHHLYGLMRLLLESETLLYG